MKDASDLRIKLDIRHSPELADGESRVWARAQVYVVEQAEMYVPSPQDLTFQIEDGSDGQSNAVFESTGTKEAYGKSSATTGWTPWQYLTSKQAGAGSVLVYLSADRNVSDTKDFSFVPTQSARRVVIRLNEEEHFCAPSSVMDMLHGLVTACATDTSADPGTRFILEPVGADPTTVKIRHCDGQCCVGRGIEGNVLYEKLLFAGGPGRDDTFTINKVSGSEEAVTLQVDGAYVYAFWNETAGNYNLYVDGTSGDYPMAHVRIIDMRS